MGILLFGIWYISFMIIIILIYFIQDGKLSYLPLLTPSITAHICIGIVTIGYWIISIVHNIQIKANKIIQIISIFILLFGVGFFFPKLKTIPRSPSFIINDVSQFYFTLFYEVVGFPEEKSMATSDEIFQEINKFRVEHNLKPIQSNDLLCQLANNNMKNITSLGSIRDMQTIKTYPKDEKNKTYIIEISEISHVPRSAKTLVRLKWNQFRSQAKSIIENSFLTSGCIIVSGYNIISEFEQENEK